MNTACQSSVPIRSELAFVRDLCQMLHSVPDRHASMSANLLSERIHSGQKRHLRISSDTIRNIRQGYLFQNGYRNLGVPIVGFSLTVHNLEIRLYGVEGMEAGEAVDSKKDSRFKGFPLTL